MFKDNNMYQLYTWLPAAKPIYSAMPLKIIKAHDTYLVTEDGRKIYDAVSSWWCKPLGHCHPVIATAINRQLEQFEQHIPANLYNDTIEELSIRLINLFSNMDKVMYASDGSSAIEMAMKLSYETRILKAEPRKTKFIALTNAYHGETVLSLSVCGIASFRQAYTLWLLDNYFITDIPYVNSRHDALWSQCNYDFARLEEWFASVAHEVTALIIEPIVQGASGMKIISRDFLIRLLNLAHKYAIHVISDEIMVGLGRLGCHSVTQDMLDFEPEFICFAKNLTAGSIPMSAVVINRSITQEFIRHNKAFLHSHTHSCNSLAAAAAIGYLQYLESSSLLSDVNTIEGDLLQLIQELASQFNWIKNPRAIGAIAACELEVNQEVLDNFFTLSVKHGIYLRPLGNTLYLLPPLYNLQRDIDEIRAKLRTLCTEIEQHIL